VNEQRGAVADVDLAVLEQRRRILQAADSRKLLKEGVELLRCHVLISLVGCVVPTRLIEACAPWTMTS
jgi:hypothetical protein